MAQAFDTTSYNDKADCRLFFMHDKLSPEGTLENTDLVIKTIQRLVHGGGKNAARDGSDGIGWEINIQWKNISERYLNGAEVPKGAAQLHTNHQWTTGTAEERATLDKVQQLTKEAYEKFGFSVFGEYDRDKNLEYHKGSKKKDHCYVLERPKDIALDNEKGMNDRLAKAGSHLRNLLRENDISIPQANIVSASTDTEVFKATCLITDLHKLFPELAKAQINYACIHIRYATGVTPTDDSCHPHKGYAGTVTKIFNGESTNYKSAGAKATLRARRRGHEEVLVLPGLTDTAQQSATEEYESRALNKSTSEISVIILSQNQNDPKLDTETKANLEVNTLFHEPWNGPSNGITIIDRKLRQRKDPLEKRPMHYINSNRYFILCSDPGAFPVDPEDIINHGRVRKTIGYDMDTKTVLFEKDILAEANIDGLKRNGETYQQMRAKNIEDLPVNDFKTVKSEDYNTNTRDITRKMNFFGITEEDRRTFIFHPARTGTYQNVQMNADAQPQALRDNKFLDFSNSISLDHSQIFRPAISSELYPNQIDTSAYIGVPGKTKMLKAEMDLLFPGQMDQILDRVNAETPGSAEKFKIIFDKNESIPDGLERISNDIIDKVKSGKLTHICLSDKYEFTDNDYAVNPVIAAAHISKRLMEHGLTNDCTVMVQSGQLFEAHQIKALSRLGNTSAVDAYLVPEILDNGIKTTSFLKRFEVNLVDSESLAEVAAEYNKHNLLASQKVNISIKQNEDEPAAFKRIADEVIKKAKGASTAQIILTDKFDMADGEKAIDVLKLVSFLDKELQTTGVAPKLAIQSADIFTPEHIQQISGNKLVHHVDAYTTSFLNSLDLGESMKNYYDEDKKGCKGYDGLACISNAISGKGSRLAYFQGVDMNDPYFADIFGAYQVRDDKGKMIQLSDSVYSDIGGKGINDYQQAAVIASDEAFKRDKNPLTRRLRHFGEREMKQETGVAHTMSAKIVEAMQAYIDTNINETRIDQIKNSKPFEELSFKEKLVRGFTEENFRELTVEEINSHETSPQWKKCEAVMKEIHTADPTRFIDLMSLAAKTDDNGKLIGPISRDEAGTVHEVLSTMFGGNASIPAITPSAHRAIRQGMRLVGRVIGTGEGGFSEGDLYERDTAPNDLQFGTAMFGATPIYLSFAMMGAEIDEKEGQGAKAYGGKQVADKMTPEFAFLRRTPPWVNLNSPFHKVFMNSIEDKNPYFVTIRPDLDVPSTIKISPNADVVSMVLGAAKFQCYPGPAADGKCGTVNLASKDGGTASSDSNSATHTILLNARSIKESRLSLDSSGFHTFINLRGSGLFHSSDDFISARQLGNDQSECMTMLMNLVGCIHIRQCDKAKEKGCTVGVANNEEAFRGEYMNVARTMLDISSHILDKCAEKGWKFSEIIGNPKSIELVADLKEKFPGLNTEWLHKESDKKILTPEEIARTQRLVLLEDKYIEPLREALQKGEKLQIVDIVASHEDSSFGARLMHEINKVIIQNNLEAFQEVEAAEKAFFKFKFDAKQQDWLDNRLSERMAGLDEEIKVKFAPKEGVKYSIQEMHEFKLEREFDIRDEVFKEFEKKFPAMVRQREELWENIQTAHDKLSEAKQYIAEDSYVFNIKTVSDKETGTGFGSTGHHFGSFLTQGQTVNITGNMGDVAGFCMGSGSILTCKPEIEDLGATVGKHACAHASGGKAFFACPLDAEAFTRASGVMGVCEGMGNYSMHFATDCFVLDLGFDPKKIASGVYGPDMTQPGQEIGTMMSGGMLVKYDPEKQLNSQVNQNFLNVHTLDQRPEFYETVRSMLQEHIERTGSTLGKERLEALENNPEAELKNYSVAIPKQLEKMTTKQLYDYEEVLMRRELQDGKPHQGMEFITGQLERLGLTTQQMADQRYREGLNDNQFAMAR